jgi:hypothetical protein
VGLEPTLSYENWILSPARLPFRHFGSGVGNSSVSRTGCAVKGAGSWPRSARGTAYRGQKKFGAIAYDAGRGFLANSGFEYSWLCLDHFHDREAIAPGPFGWLLRTWLSRVTWPQSLAKLPPSTPSLPRPERPPVFPDAAASRIVSGEQVRNRSDAPGQDFPARRTLHPALTPVCLPELAALSQKGWPGF